jgi:hypothetical protein
VDEQKKSAVAIAVGQKKSKNADKLQYLIDLYAKLHPDEDKESVRPDLVAEWAVDTGRWTKPPATPEEMLRRELARHLRGTYFVDAKGRTVRANHPLFVEVKTTAGVKRRSRWIRLYSAMPDEILISAQLRRNAALADVQQLELDLASYDDFNVHGAKLPQRNYDFNKDMADAAQPATYPAEPHDDDEDDKI